MAGVCCWPAAALASEGQRDLASKTLAVLSAKCAGCHGPNLPKPKGRFGYVLDLARVAANPEMVVPGAPDESELWELVRRGEMPRDGSPTGPLSDKEKGVLHDWIAAGAPGLLFLHRWIGTSAAILSVGAALLSEWDERRQARSPWFRAWLFCAALLVAVEGHFGGMLVHGDDFLSGG